MSSYHDLNIANSTPIRWNQQNAYLCHNGLLINQSERYGIS